jgi:hypothetical protein
MSGALYLTEDQPELAEYFEPAKSPDLHRSPGSARQVRYYLAHQEASDAFATLASCALETTRQHRFRELFGVLV